MTSTIAPPGKFRVVAWRGAERHCTVEGDFDLLGEAKKHADALLPDVFNASVFSSIGACVHDAQYPGISHGAFNRSLSITRLAGLDDPLTRKRGTYKRRR